MAQTSGAQHRTAASVQRRLKITRHDRRMPIP
jgi:hypothetical protein